MPPACILVSYHHLLQASGHISTVSEHLQVRTQLPNGPEIGHEGPRTIPFLASDSAKCFCNPPRSDFLPPSDSI